MRSIDPEVPLESTYIIQCDRERHANVYVGLPVPEFVIA